MNWRVVTRNFRVGRRQFCTLQLHCHTPCQSVINPRQVDLDDIRIPSDESDLGEIPIVTMAAAAA